MRKRCLDTVYELAKQDTNIVFIGSDLGAGTLDKFKDEMPDRFFMEGISEQHIVGMAAGLAMSGKEVYVNTIATFLTRRCYEQIIIDLALTKAKVRLIGSGGGVVYAPLGATHTAIEDIALMRAIPNMTILVPADANEMEAMIKECPNIDSPVYIRVAKGGDPLITKSSNDTVIGKAVKYRKGNEVLLITTGTLLNTCLQLYEVLNEKGINAGVLHVNTIAPLDIEGIVNAVNGAKFVFTFEEHVAMGGLGSAIAETILENAAIKPDIFKRFSLGHDFMQGYGSQYEQLSKCCLSVDTLQQQIIEIIGNR